MPGVPASLTVVVDREVESVIRWSPGRRGEPWSRP